MSHEFPHLSASVSPRSGEATAIPCYLPKCDGYLVRKSGTHGVFFGCTKFSLTGCRATMNTEAAEEQIAVVVYGHTFDRNEPHYGE